MGVYRPKPTNQPRPRPKIAASGEHYCLTPDWYAKWQFCERCGAPLEGQAAKRFDRATGAYIEGPYFKKCPNGHQSMQLWTDEHLPPPPVVYHGRP